jgi:hypothetical protein
MRPLSTVITATLVGVALLGAPGATPLARATGDTANAINGTYAATSEALGLSPQRAALTCIAPAG